MRPCAMVLRKIFPVSMPGSRMAWVYSARPVTFSRASRRGSERPICPPALVVAIGPICSLARRPDDTLLHKLVRIIGNERPDLRLDAAKLGKDRLALIAGHEHGGRLDD